MSDVAEQVLARVAAAFAEERDPERAAGQAAYMRDQFPFLGLTLPQVRKLAKQVLKEVPRPGEGDLSEIVTRCWAMPEREWQYFGVEVLRSDALTPAFLPTVRTLIVTKPWWDTVDHLATRVVGDLVRGHRELAAEMDAWSSGDQMWLIRTAILHQLHWGTDTDTRRLFGYCTTHAAHQDFFIRKAIGWALRHYARTDPSAVRAYVDAHRSELSSLSVREATKHL